MPTKTTASTPRARKKKVPARPARAGARSSSGSRTRKRPLVEAEGEHCFWIHNGPIVSTLRELREALAHEVSDEQFLHHFGGGRNDFARWAADVLQDASCASALRRARSRASAVRALDACLKRYQ